VRFLSLAGMIAVIAVIAAVVATGPAAGAQLSTECSPNGLCYCVSDDLKSTIAARVEAIRAGIVAQRQQGKAIGYLSIPISTIAGAYLGVNAEIAAGTKARVEQRFGSASLWLLNTAAKDFALPGTASGADYMLMWTRVLEGNDGLGRDFDFVYFTDPSDFGQYFAFDGRADRRSWKNIMTAMPRPMPACGPSTRPTFAITTGFAPRCRSASAPMTSGTSLAPSMRNEGRARTATTASG
jgi:hypothetical protein